MAVRPPKLTRKQFLGNRPGGKYQNYLNAYNRMHPDPGRLVNQRATPTISSLLSRVGQFETPAQLEARANRMANQGIATQQRAIREEAKLMRDEAQKRMLAQAAAGREAAAQNAGLFGMVGGQYNAAAQEIQNLGSNLSMDVAGMTGADVAAQNAGLAAVGAPGLTVGGPAGGVGLGGEQQAALEAYRSATIPAQEFGTAGQAAQFGLAGMVSAQNLRATQEAQAAFVGATQKADAARLAAVKELQAGRPEQASKFLVMLQEAQRQQMGLASGLIQQQAAMRQAGFGQTMAKKEFAAKQQQQGFQNRMALTQMGIDYGQVDPTRSLALGYVVDKRGNPILKNGKRIPASRLLTGTGSSSKTRNLTPGQRVELVQNAQQMAESAFYGYKVVNGKRVPANEAPDFDPNDSSTWGTGSQGYGTALSRLRQLGLGAGDAQSILDTYYERGDSGRPVFSPQEMTALKKQYGPNRLNWVTSQINTFLRNGQGAEADNLINRVLSGGRGINWPKKWQIQLPNLK